MFDALLVSPGQRTTQGSDIGQPAQTQGAFDQGVIGIVAEIAQLPIAEQEVQHQAQNQDGIAEDGTDCEMTKTAAQSLLQSQTREQLLNEDEPREGGELAVFKPKCG
ncbi:MAG: hypothetical protein ACREV4_01120, partial [Gammaproteobacteria bacterium]